MNKGASQQIEVCIFYDKDGANRVSNVKLEVRRGSGGGFLEVQPIAKMSVGGRADPLEKRFSKWGLALSTSSTRTTTQCWGTSGLDIFAARNTTPCGTFSFPGGHLTFGAVRFDKNYREIDRVTHK